jgi:hypothetical protein
MGYGQELITDPNDRLISSIGNWVSSTDPPNGEFIWSGDHARIFSEMGIQFIRGILAKDFFSTIRLNTAYELSCYAFWPSTSHDGSVSIDIRDADGHSLGIAFAKDPPDVWRFVLGGGDPQEIFDNDSRELSISMSNIEYEPVEVFIKNLSIRAILPKKVQYLPLMGVG